MIFLCFFYFFSFLLYGRLVIFFTIKGMILFVFILQVKICPSWGKQGKRKRRKKKKEEEEKKKNLMGGGSFAFGTVWCSW